MCIYNFYSLVIWEFAIGKPPWKIWVCVIFMGHKFAVSTQRIDVWWNLTTHYWWWDFNEGGICSLTQKMVHMPITYITRIWTTKKWGPGQDMPRFGLSRIIFYIKTLNLLTIKLTGDKPWEVQQRHQTTEPGPQMAGWNMGVSIVMRVPQARWMVYFMA